MKRILCLAFLIAGVCGAQEPGDFKPAESNVMNAQYPRVDSAGRGRRRTRRGEAPLDGCVGGSQMLRNFVD